MSLLSELQKVEKTCGEFFDNLAERKDYLRRRNFKKTRKFYEKLQTTLFCKSIEREKERQTKLQEQKPAPQTAQKQAETQKSQD